MRARKRTVLTVNFLAFFADFLNNLGFLFRGRRAKQTRSHGYLATAAKIKELVFGSLYCRYNHHDFLFYLELKNLFCRNCFKNQLIGMLDIEF